MKAQNFKVEGGRYHLTPVRMAVTENTTSVGEDVGKREPLCPVGENVN